LIREVIEIARHLERLELHSNEANGLQQLSEETRKYIQLLISAVECGWKDSIAAVQQNLHRIYLKQQIAVLESAQQKSTLHAAAVIASFLKSGAKLRWGSQGWEVQRTGMLVSSEVVEQLNEMGFITLESDLGRDEEWPGEFFHDLLSNQGIEGLDKISRRAFRTNQNRAYFEYLHELLELYQEHSTLREGVISYPALVREKIRFAYHVAWLYLAGILHLLGITEKFRVRIAQCSLNAIGSLTG
jgi:sorbitol-specific phosphotransferase system component IIA